MTNRQKTVLAAARHRKVTVVVVNIRFLPKRECSACLLISHSMSMMRSGEKPERFFMFMPL
ncbi:MULTISPECIES: hypothetical protein [Paenibacillus]|uniref:hypothetical protein n=1 Tax=Paenibacillus TaxID=44249 RepID=UPI002282DBBF|nr:MULTISPECIES: hypothetical protein [Paenibacillus]MCY7483803.1 hypothetical protein [Paenibacillus alvei]